MYCFRVLAFAVAIVGALSDCEWNVNNDLAEKDPVFVRKYRGKYGLYYPITTNVELKRNQVLQAICTGTEKQHNTISGTDKPSVRIACDGGKNVKVDGGEIKDISSISCSKNIAADVMNTSENILSIGYQTEFGWLELFKSVYNFELLIPVYTQHVLHGSSIKGTYTGKASRPSFKSNGLPSNVSWTKIFTKSNQKDVLSKILGESKAEECLKNNYIARGHMAPDADFYFHSWEIGTYFYANVVPQWQSINGGNWLRIENAIRNKAKELEEDLIITTGAEGVATFQSNSEDIPVYLDKGDSKVPVPEFIWKVVCSKSHACIALVIENNPFESSSKTVCQNVCARGRDSVNWYLNSYDDIQKGRVVCCDVRDLRNQFKSIPNLKVSGILRY